MNNRHGFLRAGIVATGVIVGLFASGSMVLRGTEAVFSSSTNNPTNAWSAGSVALGDNDTGLAMFTTTPMVPNQTLAARCITVTYTGNVSAAVKLYTSASTGTSAGNLGDYLDLTINEGTGTASADCTGFTAGTDIYTGTLSGFAAKTSHATGVSSWTPSSNPTSKAYRFTVKLQSATPAGQQGAAATATFAWEAQAGS